MERREEKPGRQREVLGLGGISKRKVDFLGRHLKLRCHNFAKHPEMPEGAGRGSGNLSESIGLEKISGMKLAKEDSQFPENHGMCGAPLPPGALRVASGPAVPHLAVGWWNSGQDQQGG